jgi:preprotein translocase subunit SecA
MDYLKEGIGLRGYGQQDPLVAYKKESFGMFEEMMLRFQEDTVRHLFRMQIIGPDGVPIDTSAQPQATSAQSQTTSAQAAPASTRVPATTIDALEKEFQRKKERDLSAARAAGGDSTSNGSAPRRTGEKVGRNDACPCGSGKKYKRCHGAVQA